MQFLALLEKVIADVTPSNIQLYINLLDGILETAEKIEQAQNQTPPQNGSAS